MNRFARVGAKPFVATGADFPEGDHPASCVWINASRLATKRRTYDKEST